MTHWVISFPQSKKETHVYNRTRLVHLLQQLAREGIPYRIHSSEYQEQRVIPDKDDPFGGSDGRA